MPIAKLESGEATGNTTGKARTLYIHSDHRGAPLAMTDHKQNVVWQADTLSQPWGQVKLVKASATTQQATLNLRLPGQYFDAETNLHDNWHRTYNPATGRYLQPDPLGYPDGEDPYLYVNGDPVNKVDPLGLYSTEVHYYMTFFLARMAGLSYEEALTIALAAQYIDENPATWPLDEQNLSGNVLSPEARNRLASYHFTTTPSEYASLTEDFDPPRTAAELAYHLASGGKKDLQSYIDRRYRNPQNSQLSRLLNAAGNAPTRCGAAQFFGEYLHALEDTYAHRNQENRPIHLNLGIGHGGYGHDPDYTYNHTVTYAEVLSRPGFERATFASVGDWNQNENRTFEMEREVFSRLRDYAGTTGKNPLTGKKITFGEIRKFLADWNTLRSEEEKITELQFMLEAYGLGPLPRFNKECAAAKRNAYIGGLDPKAYPGTILPTTAGALAAVKEACK